MVPGPPISRLAPGLLHTSNAVFFKCAPASVFWPPLLLYPGDGPEYAIGCILQIRFGNVRGCLGTNSVVIYHAASEKWEPIFLDSLQKLCDLVIGPIIRRF